MTEIVPATAEMLRRFYGRLPEQTVRALAVTEGDVVLGVTGFYPDNGRTVLFAKIGEQVERRRYVRTILICAHRILEMARTLGMPIQAVADTEIEGSNRLIEHLGAERIHREIYQWTH